MYDLKIFTDNCGPNATNQIYTLISQSVFREQRVRIMPDVHYGLGAVVGFTATLGDKVIPNVIGVDIGCGMRVVSLGNIDIDYAILDKFIKNNIPAGSSVSRELSGEDLINRLYVKKELDKEQRLLGSIGTLGGGNHFIEIDVDYEGNKYLVIHTGSRNLGLQVAKIYQKMAIEDCKNAAVAEREAVVAELKSQGRIAEIPDAIDEVNKKHAYRTKIPKELCYLDGTHMAEYLHDVTVCQEFAERNRAKIAEKILAHLGVNKYEYFETVHNYIDNDKITRKGAISAHAGEKVLIPMNMRDGCLICVGKGNEDWNYSAPHGAGRLFSRGEAKQLFTEEEFASEMKGIYTTTANSSTIDEAPMVYKPMEEIMRWIEPTVDIIKIIKPVYNFKAAE